MHHTKLYYVPPFDRPKKSVSYADVIRQQHLTTRKVRETFENISAVIFCWSFNTRERDPFLFNFGLSNGL